jgi:hypothetical protein
MSTRYRFHTGPTVLVLALGLLAILALTTRPARAEPTPAGVIEPCPGGMLFVSPFGFDNPPNFIHLLRVTEGEQDAVLYRLQLSGPSSVMLDIATGVAGDGVIGSLQLPPGTLQGSYELSCAAFDATGLQMGGWSAPIPVDVLELPPQPVMPVGPVEMSGVVLATEVMIPPGVVVTAVADLTIMSLGPVNIHGDVVGLDGQGPSLDGAAIRILTLGGAEVNGSILGGAGAEGLAVTAIGEPAVAGSGGGGGDLVLIGHGSALVINPTAHLSSGGGGGGGCATSQGLDAAGPGQSGGSAAAYGGGGGGGGCLAVHADGAPLMHPYLPGIFHCGDGGPGGEAEALGGVGGVGDAGLPEGPGGGAIGASGGGGASGSLFIASQDLDGDQDGILSELELAIVGGGGGGAAGASTAVGGDNGQPYADKNARADCFRPNGQKPAPVQDIGAKGGDGWINPGPGGAAFAYGIDGPPGGDGGDAIAIGGDGGNLKMIGVSLGPISLGYSMVTMGARGGDATARGGHGGAPSGSGGNATATGGKGGSGPMVGLPNGGGFGGFATATGGNGKRAPDCCNPPQGNPHNGGNGGGAYAVGGAGGDASQHGGGGGAAFAIAGRCGNGGDGNGPSAGGLPGPANPTGGTGGTGTIFNGSNGSAFPYPAAGCSPGKLCAPQCRDGVRTIEPTEPVDGIGECEETQEEPDKTIVPCALFCPAGDLAVVMPILHDDAGGLPVVGLPADRYGIEVDGLYYDGAAPTDAAGRGVIPYAADEADRDGCREGVIYACGGIVYGPFKVLSVDLNADGVVDQADLDAIQLHFGTSASCYDLDGSGLVDLADVALVQQHQGHALPPTGVEQAPGLVMSLLSYPNPFNPRTTIRFEMAVAGTVGLKVVDPAGRAVRSLLCGELPAGRHEVDWNGIDDEGRAVAAGVYLVVLDTPQGRRIGKVAVLK